MFQFKTIRMNILFSFSIVIIIVAAYSTYNFIHTSTSANQTDIIVNEELQLLTIDNDIAQTMALRIAAVRGYVLSGNPKYKTIFTENMELASEQGAKLHEITSSDIYEKYHKMEEEWNTYIQTSVFAVYDAGDTELAIKNLVAMDSTATEIRLGFKDLATNRTEKINTTGQAMIDSNETAKWVTVILGLLTVILSIFIASISATKISKNIVTVTTRMKNIAQGDFSEPLLEVRTKDEIAQLTEATNTVVRTMNRMLKDIQVTSNEVAAHSEDLMQSAVEVKSGTEQVSTTVAEIASGTESQASNAADVASTMSDFSTKMSDVNKRNNQIQGASSNVLALTSEGQSLMDASTQQMTTIDTIVKDAVIKVEQLGKETQEISQIVQVIHAIADQTNLLSLNAAIEAARAGEHGKGFAVVADEVRKLADQVTYSVGGITKIVERILTGSNLVMTSLESGYKEVERGTSQIAMTGDTFTKISNALNEMSLHISDMSSKLEDVVANTATINHAVDEIAAVSQQSAAGIEETSATVEQVTGSMDEISSSAATLAQMAENLNANVRQFKLFNA
ncbi:methyl-accepting chemotaxis protein [Solibacillus sp. MA9]|uniref:Methyl-accepting chemotaxis protein n=1 Tax=Solibacillus palustris TaxID=2908203 RepID=A0ABS9UHJ5_9BACL|nr:methyl-accepting chemotaxis protein [Solibacillus sp. MA9]MCH7323840.1 methyl-accepting chemotaxis protein [Solibacillus sp. MA9]